MNPVALGLIGFGLIALLLDPNEKKNETEPEEPKENKVVIPSQVKNPTGNIGADDEPVKTKKIEEPDEPKKNIQEKDDSKEGKQGSSSVQS